MPRNNLNNLLNSYLFAIIFFHNLLDFHLFRFSLSNFLLLVFCWNVREEKLVRYSLVRAASAATQFACLLHHISLSLILLNLFYLFLAHFIALSCINPFFIYLTFKFLIQLYFILYYIMLYSCLLLSFSWFLLFSIFINVCLFFLFLRLLYSDSDSRREYWFNHTTNEGQYDIPDCVRKQKSEIQNGADSILTSTHSQQKMQVLYCTARAYVSHT